MKFSRNAQSTLTTKTQITTSGRTRLPSAGGRATTSRRKW